MPFVDSFRQELLDYLFGGDPTPRPGTSWWLGLSTTTPSVDGSNITEPPGAANYARVEVTHGDGSWTNAAGAPLEVSNVPRITFPTASASWGTITHFVLFKSELGADPVAFDAITPTIEVVSGTGAEFPTGELVFNIT